MDADVCSIILERRRHKRRIFAVARPTQNTNSSEYLSPVGTYSEFQDSIAQHFAELVNLESGVDPYTVGSFSLKHTSGKVSADQIHDIDWVIPNMTEEQLIRVVCKDLGVTLFKRDGQQKYAEDPTISRLSYFFQVPIPEKLQETVIVDEEREGAYSKKQNGTHTVDEKLPPRKNKKDFKFDVLLVYNPQKNESEGLSDIKAILEADYKHRDFTMGAIYVSWTANGPLKVYDFGQGLRDFKKGYIRVVDPKTFSYEPDRGMRAGQITARYPGIKVHPDSKQVLLEHSNLCYDPEKPTFIGLDIKSVNDMRVALEKLLLGGSDVWNGLKFLRDYRLLRFWVEFDDLIGKKVVLDGHSMNAINHALKSVAALTERYNTRRTMRNKDELYAALFRDLCLGTNGKINFEESAERAKNALRKLRVSYKQCLVSEISDYLEDADVSDEWIAVETGQEDVKLSKRVSTLISLSGHPRQIVEGGQKPLRALKELAEELDEISGLNLNKLLRVAMAADVAIRAPRDYEMIPAFGLSELYPLYTLAEREKILYSPAQSILSGKEIVDTLTVWLSTTMHKKIGRGNIATSLVGPIRDHLKGAEQADLYTDSITGLEYLKELLKMGDLPDLLRTVQRESLKRQETYKTIKDTKKSKANRAELETLHIQEKRIGKEVTLKIATIKEFLDGKLPSSL